MPPADRFPTTRFSLLGEASNSPQALEQIAELYWRPVYKHLRLKWRMADEDAREFTQASFSALIDDNWIGGFDAQRGSFRTFLRTCVDRLVMDARQAESRLKRGGGNVIAMDFAAADRELALADPAPNPEEAFEREWRRQVLSLAVDDLRLECETSGKQVRFALFADYDLAEGDRPGYEDLARQHALPVTQVTNHLAWARRELRRLALARVDRRDAAHLFGA